MYQQKYVRSETQALWAAAVAAAQLKMHTRLNLYTIYSIAAAAQYLPRIHIPYTFQAVD